jgi:hypothetical protein
LLAGLFLCSYEAEFTQKLLQEMNKLHAEAFNSMFYRINNNQFHLYVDSIYMYTNELEIIDTTESSTSASYLDILLNIDAGGKHDNSIV